MEHHKQDQREGWNEHHSKHYQCGEGNENLPEHDNVDGNHRNVGHHEDQVYPTKKHAGNSNLPLPLERAATVVNEHKHNKNNRDVEQDPFQVVIDAVEIFPSSETHPQDFLDDVIDDQNNHTDRTNAGNDATSSGTCKRRIRYVPRGVHTHTHTT